MATAAMPTDLVTMIATEISTGVERAVEYWLAQVDQIVMSDKIPPELKLTAIQTLLRHYRRLTGKGSLEFAQNG